MINKIVLMGILCFTPFPLPQPRQRPIVKRIIIPGNELSQLINPPADGKWRRREQLERIEKISRQMERTLIRSIKTSNEEDDSSSNQLSIRRPRTKTSETGLFKIEDSSSRFNFTTIGGYNSVKEELLQVADMMKNRQIYEQYDLRMPRGVLLEGPPGNGKTLMAKCFAGEVNASFIACSGSDFQDKYVGVASARIKELFGFAQENKPVVVFIDELDALGRSRTTQGEEAGAERDSTLNQLLVQMDGFHVSEDMLVLAATNRVDILDKALTRPGRFDKIIHVPNPDESTRTKIAQIHMKRKPISTTPEAIGGITRGFSGAMIENLLNEASLYAIRKGLSLPVGMPVLQKIVDQMTMGTSSETKTLNEEVARRVAVHEVGHLLIAIYSEAHDNPIRISIETPSHRLVGVTVFDGPGQGADIGVVLPEYMNAHLMVLLGGKAAEEVVFGSSSAGCISDLQSAMNMSKRMLLELGMGEQIIYPLFSEKDRQRIGDEILTMMDNKYKECLRILTNKRELIDAIAQRLVLEKTLEIAQVLEMMG